MQSNIHPWKLLLSLGLNYLRWTQLTPMLMMWGFAVLMLLALILVNYQEQTLSAVENVLKWLVQLPVVGEHITQILSDQSTEERMTKSEIKSYALRAWTISSLVFMLASMAISALFGPFKPWTLKRKFLLTGFGILLLLAGLVLINYLNPGNFNGEASGWMLTFSLLSLTLFLASAYSLSVSHFLRLLDDGLMARDFDKIEGLKRSWD